VSDIWARRDSDLKYGHGSALWKYWTRGEGFAKWSGAVHKWTALRDLLLAAGVPSVSVDGLATNIIMAVMPGYMKLAHAKEHKAGRSAVTTMTERADTKPYGNVTYADPKNGKYPVDTAAHAKAAWSYVNMPKNAAQYPMNGVNLSDVKDRIMAACKKFGIDVDGDSDSSASRGDEDAPLSFRRDFPLQDISIRAGGDGRTVTAYATVFDTPVPIHDQQGDYIEVIDRHAFDRILPKLQPQGDRKAWRVGVFYNHGMTLHATPSDRNSVPIGVPLEVTVDSTGLKTVTRFHRGELADQILEAIKEGSLGAYSFSGRFDRSVPGVPRGGFKADRHGNLPAVRRTESTLREYGPTPFPAYQDAVITGVRAEKIAEQLQYITELIRSGAPLDSPLSGAPADRDSLTDDLLTAEGEESPEGEEHSARYHQNALFRMRLKEAREKVGLVW
jgi:HK97 family phage prohead protease